jgi:hypothetical protein
MGITLLASRLANHQPPKLAPGDQDLAGTIEISALSGRTIFLDQLCHCVVGKVLGERCQVDFLRGHKLAIPK